MEVDLDKMADRVAEKALDEFTYNGKTIREWVEIIVAQDLLAITELEKIKTEILKLQPKQSEDFYSCKRKVFDILNNRIEELKGENDG